MARIYSGVADATSTTVSQQVNRGKTTQAEVRGLYGAPSQVSLAGATETWTYTYTRMQMKPANYIPVASLFAGGANVEKTIVVYIFYKNKVVQDYTINQ